VIERLVLLADQSVVVSARELERFCRPVLTLPPPHTVPTGPHQPVQPTGPQRQGTRARGYRRPTPICRAAAVALAAHGGNQSRAAQAMRG
jgi:hypothetical protein